MSWRLASRLSVITLAVLVVILVTILQSQRTSMSQPASTTNTGSNTTSMTGTDLGKKPAPGFQLTDQFGKTVSLAQFHGKPVVVTFLYTHCPDVCPLTAEHLHTSLQQLGADAKDVAILAVSTDPRGDTTAEALKFSIAHNMQDSWHFLTGTQQELSPVWTNYSIYAQALPTSVNHSTALYLLDKQGNERIYMGEDFQPSQMAANLKQLLKEN